MKVSGNKATYQTNQTSTESKAKSSKKAGKEAEAPQKSMSQVAEGLTKSMNSRLNQLMKPSTGEVSAESQLGEIKPNENQARVQDGVLPTQAKPEANSGLAEGSQIPHGPAEATHPEAEALRADRGPAGGDLNFEGPGKHSDGRTPDSDIGTGSGPAGNPYAGMDESAAGKLPAHQQATIDAYKEKALEAAANGDFEGANRWASAVSQELGKGPGTDGSQPPADAPTEENDSTSDDSNWFSDGLKNLITGRAFNGGEPTETEKAANAIDIELDANAGTEGDGVGEKERAKQAAEAGQENGGNADNSTNFFTPGGMNEDREQDSEGGPEVWTEFTDQFGGEAKIRSKAGETINPGDSVQGPAANYGPANTETYTANYGEGHTEVTEDQVAAGKQRAKDAADIDEEA